MSSAFAHHASEFAGLPGGKLADQETLSGVVIAAASAIGLNAFGPPTVRSGPHGVAVCLTCHGGHIAVHTVPELGVCFVDIVARPPAALGRGIDVIARRLGASGSRAGGG